MPRKIIKSKLDEYSLTQAWLINQLYKRGIVTERSEFSAILSGTRSGKKVDDALKVSLEILNDYENNFENN